MGQGGEINSERVLHRSSALGGEEEVFQSGLIALLCRRVRRERRSEERELIKHTYTHAHTDKRAHTYQTKG